MTRLRNPAKTARASDARTPVSVAIPASSSNAIPLPAVRESGSSIAAMTRAGPALTSMGAPRRTSIRNMSARFERNINRSARCLRPSLGQCHRFGMRASAGLGPTASDNNVILDDNAPDGGVFTGPAHAALGQRQGCGHKPLVSGRCYFVAPEEAVASCAFQCRVRPLLRARCARHPCRPRDRMPYTPLFLWRASGL